MKRSGSGYLEKAKEGGKTTKEREKESKTFSGLKRDGSGFDSANLNLKIFDVE